MYKVADISRLPIEWNNSNCSRRNGDEQDNTRKGFPAYVWRMRVQGCAIGMSEAEAEAERSVSGHSSDGVVDHGGMGRADVLIARYEDGFVL